MVFKNLCVLVLRTKVASALKALNEFDHLACLYNCMVPISTHDFVMIRLHQILGLGIGCKFMIDNQLQPTDRLSIIISSSHFCSNWVLEV